MSTTSTKVSDTDVSEEEDITKQIESNKGSEGLGVGDAATMKKFLTAKVDKNKSLWKMTVETMRMAEGNHKKNDVCTSNLEEALAELEKMVAKAEKDSKKWAMPWAPLEALQATRQDLMRAFVKWSYKGTRDDDDDDDEDDKNKKKANNKVQGFYNISKTFRRMESYVDWMEDHSKDLMTPAPLDHENVQKASELFSFYLTHDAKDRLVWWLDMAAMDIDKIKKDKPYTEILRYFVWISHVIMLDEKAQTNGIVFIEGMNQVGIVDAFTMIPMDLSAKLDRLTIGVLPIKLKGVQMFGMPGWLSFMLGLMKAFMSKKLRKRIVTLKETGEELEKIIFKEVGGRQYVPKGFFKNSSGDGWLEEDILAASAPMVG